MSEKATSTPAHGCVLAVVGFQTLVIFAATDLLEFAIPDGTSTSFQTATAVATSVAQTDGMIYVPAGGFLMGSLDDDPDASEAEKPQHSVYLDAYWIDRVEVTHAAYAQCVKAGVCEARHHIDSYLRGAIIDSQAQFSCD